MCAAQGARANSAGWTRPRKHHLGSLSAALLAPALKWRRLVGEGKPGTRRAPLKCREPARRGRPRDRGAVGRSRLLALRAAAAPIWQSTPVAERGPVPARGGFRKKPCWVPDRAREAGKSLPNATARAEQEFLTTRIAPGRMLVHQPGWPSSPAAYAAAAPCNCAAGPGRNRRPSCGYCRARVILAPTWHHRTRWPTAWMTATLHSADRETGGRRHDGGRPLSDKWWSTC